MEAQTFWRRSQCDPMLCTGSDSATLLPRRPLGLLLTGIIQGQPWRSPCIHSDHQLLGALYLHLSRAVHPWRGIYDMLFAPTSAYNLQDRPMTPGYSS
jgi:hypothetical protein